MLDEMVNLDEERQTTLYVLIRQKERVAKANNMKVKEKAFSIEDFIWQVILPTDRRDKTLGKWSPNQEGPFQIIEAFQNNGYEIEELAIDKQILKVNGKYMKRL